MKQHLGRTFPQYFAAISACVIVAAAGSCIAWPSPVLKKISSGEANFRLSQSEAAWIVALKNVGNLLAPLPAGLLMARTGRRTALLCSALPFVVSWFLVVVSASALPLYVARILGGVGVGMAFTISPVYLGEIAQDQIRGALTTLMQVMLYVGILFEYSVGPHVSYFWLALASGTIPTLFLALFAFQPESPAYLVSCGRVESARKALVRLRGSQELADDEIRVLERRDSSPNKSAGLRDAIRDLRVRRALLIVVVLQVLKEMSGNSAVVAYAAPTLSKRSPNGDIYTIILGITMLASTVICSQLVDRAGRRPLLLTSCCVSSVALTGAAFALDRDDVPDWLPLAALVMYGAAFSLGLAPIPSALLAELFPTEMRETAAATASASLSLASLVVTKLFQIVADHWGLDVVFFAFAANCLVGAVFVYYIVPETKCKSLEMIQEDLAPSKKDNNLKDIPLMDIRLP